MGYNLDRRWRKMIKISEEASETKKRVTSMTRPDHSDPLRRVLITEEYLDEQFQDQLNYYNTYRYVSNLKPCFYHHTHVITTISKPEEGDHDVIFELLQVEERLSIAIPLRRANRAGRHSQQLRERLVAAARENPLTPEELSSTTEGSELNVKIQTLLEKTNTTRDDWAKDGLLYTQCRRNSGLKKLHKIQSTIVRVVTERTLELDILHHRTRGHKQAKKAITAINSRWRQLDRLVNNYNSEVRRINSGGQELEISDLELREINARDIRERGIECNEVWDVDRMLSRSDWARYPFVREGIESCFLLKRVIEERERLQLHLRRMCRWLLRQCRVLLQILDPASHVTIHQDAVKILLLQRGKVAANLLEIKHGDLLSPQTRELLEGR